MVQIVEAYFVKKGFPKGGENIIQKIFDNKILPPLVRHGHERTTNVDEIGYDPFPGIVKDLIIVVSENGVVKDMTFSESDNNKRGVNDYRKITIIIP